MTVQKDNRIVLAENVLTMLRWREEYHRKRGNIDMCIAYGSAADMLWYALNEDADCLAQFDYSGGNKMKQIQLFDIKNNPQKVNRILENRIDELDLELYILAEGNHFAFDDSVILALKKLVKDIEYYIL